MKESLTIIVLVNSVEEPNLHDKEVELRFDVNLHEDIMSILLDGEEIAICDWSYNLKKLFSRALEIWTEQETENREVVTPARVIGNGPNNSLPETQSEEGRE